MVESRPWDWKKNDQDFWNEPSAESYYLVDRWQKKGYQKFLDLGCGLGRHSLLFARRGFAVSALDLSPEAVASLRVKGADCGIDCSCGNMVSLPWPDSTFDCLLAYHVISHTDTAGIRAIVDEIERVLKNGGEFFVTVCSKKSWSYRDAGYPRHDDNTVIKTGDGPENGVPHFYADDSTVREIFSGLDLINVRLVQDIVASGSELRDSWHYFILGTKA